MKKYIGTALAAFAAISLNATSASTHDVPWKSGESRQVGFGSCAKGPCLKRSTFAEGKPHRHESQPYKPQPYKPQVARKQKSSPPVLVASEGE
jgi:hypothetical protein